MGEIAGSLKCCLLWMLFFCTLSGCSDSKTHGVVQGKVTLDGKPLEEGVVRFVPIEGASPTASAAVLDGKFTATVPVGRQRLECSAPKLMGKRKMYDTADSPEVEIVGELIPARFNVQSELWIDVTAGKFDHVIELSSE